MDLNSLNYFFVFFRERVDCGVDTVALRCYVIGEIFINENRTKGYCRSTDKRFLNRNKWTLHVCVCYA